MTLIIGMNFGPYAILAADSRTCYYPAGQPTRFKDNTEKVQLTKLGLVAGTGLSSFIEAVSDRFRHEEISSNARIREIIREEKPMAIAAARSNARALEGIEATSWMCAYATTTDGDIPTLANTHMRLAVSMALDDYDPFLKPINSGCMNTPFGMAPEDEAEITRFLKEGFRHWEPGTEFREHLGHHVALVRNAMQKASLCCETVVSSYQIGLMTISWEHFITPILNQGDRFPLNLDTVPGSNQEPLIQ